MGLKCLGKIGFGFFDELFQLGNLPNFFKGTDFILLVTINCETCRVISSIFETREA